MTRLLDTDRRLRVRLGLGSLLILLLTAALTLPHIRAASQTGRTSPSPRFEGVVMGHVDTYRSGTGSQANLSSADQMLCGFRYPDGGKTDWTWEIHWELTGRRSQSDVYTFRLSDHSQSGATSDFATVEDVHYDGKSSVIVFQNDLGTVSIEPGSIPLNQDGKPSDVAGRAKTPVVEEPPNTDTGWRRFELIVVGPDGEAVPNARIDVFPFKPRLWTVHIGSIVGPGRSGTLLTADPNGRLAFNIPSNEPMSMDLAIRTDGYGPFFSRWNNRGQSEPIPPRYTARLDAGTAIGGVVVDEDGEPVESAKINLGHLHKNRDGGLSRLHATQRKTDAQGKWSYASLPASLETLPIEIDHPQYMPLRTPVSTREFAIEDGKQPTAKTVLKRGATVTGTVTDAEGAAVAGAIVRTSFMNHDRDATTDDQGVYRLVGCEPVGAALVVTAKGHAPDLKDVVIEPGMAPVDFILQPGRTIRVRVIDAQGAPIPRTRIHFESWRAESLQDGGWQREGHVQKLAMSHQYTDENGVWEWNDAPADPVICDIWPPGGMTLSGQALLARNEEYVFTFVPPQVITGSVRDAQTKQPIKNFRVVPGYRNDGIDWSRMQSVAAKASWQRQESFDATDGTYRIDHADDRLASRFVILIEADGYGSAVSREIESDEGSVTVDFKLSKGTNVDGQVLSLDGIPVGRAKVTLGTPDSSIYVHNGEVSMHSPFCDRTVTDDDGRFSFRPQETPFVLLVTHAEGYAQVESQPDATPTTIRLKPWGGVEGTFRIGTKPVDGEAIRLSQRGIRDGEAAIRVWISSEAITDSDGRFRFTRVVPGTAHIGPVVKYAVRQHSARLAHTHRRPIDLQSGRTVRVDLGGTGRPVVGRLAPPAGLDVSVNWDFALAELEPILPAPPDLPFPDEIRDNYHESRAWWAKWSATDEGKAWRKQHAQYSAQRDAIHRYAATVEPDGTFRLEDIPADEYELTVRLTAVPGAIGEKFRLIGTLSHTFSVRKMDGGRSDQPLDLGELILEENPPSEGR